MKCFNAANHDQLGWFQDRSLTLTTSSLQGKPPILLQVAAFVDYSITDKSTPVNVKINNKYFMQYNRNTKHNRGTQDFANLLTITTKRSDSGTNHFRALDVHHARFCTGRGLPYCQCPEALDRS